MAALLVVAIGCGGAGPRQVVRPREVAAASGAPHVSKVIDCGDLGAIPAAGQSLPALDSDGVFTVGEVILVEGGDFGKQPAVNIGGRPAVVLGRTGNNGILTRIPVGVPTGEVEVEVSHTRGRGARAVQVTRYALVAQPETGQVFVVAVGADGALTLHATLAMPGAHDVAISGDGVGGYVATSAGGKAGLAVLAMSASGGPKLVRTLPLTGTRADRVACAADGPLGVVVGGSTMTPFDTTDARNPALYDAWDLGKIAASIRAVALDPSGHTGLFLIADGNRLASVDLTRPAAPRGGSTIDLLPDEHVSLVADFGLSPTGDEAWVLAGDNREALIAGAHATRLVTVRLDGATLTRGSEVEVASAAAPTALAVARRESIAAATTIRSLSKRAAIIAAGVEREVYERTGQGGDPVVDLVANPLPFGQLARTDLEGNADILWSGEAVVGDAALTQDVRFLLAVTTKLVRPANNLELGVTGLGLEKSGTSYLALGPRAGAALLAPVAIAVTP